MNQSLHVGLFGIGLNTYWPQFPGLKDRLQGYLNHISTQLASFPQVKIFNSGLVDHPEEARRVGSLFRQQEIDLIFLYISTYALSSTVLPVAQIAKVPIIVLNLQPVPAIEYDRFNALKDRGLMTGEWLAHCQACCVPEIASVFNRASIPYHLVTGYLEDPKTWESIEEWIRAARVVKGMGMNRLGVLGHYYQGMLDVYTDMTALLATFGGHIELIEMDELAELRLKVQKQELQKKREEFLTRFEVSPDCPEEELIRAERTSVALDALVGTHQLGSLAYYYEGTAGSLHEDIITSVIAGNTLLTGSHVPVAGECEIKNVHAMKILDLLGVGGSFSEFYALDFLDDVVLLGHDGPAHFAIAEGRVKLVPLPVYHGKPGKGLSIQMTVKHGPVTLLSVCEQKGRVFLLMAQGESVPGPTLQIGNTNSRYKFDIPVGDFIDRWSKQGPSHHCAIGTGHVASILKKAASLWGIEAITIC